MISLMSAGSASGWNYLPLLEVNRVLALEDPSRSVGTGPMEPPPPAVSKAPTAIHKWPILLKIGDLRKSLWTGDLRCAGLVFGRRHSEVGQKPRR